MVIIPVWCINTLTLSSGFAVFPKTDASKHTPVYATIDLATLKVSSHCLTHARHTISSHNLQLRSPPSPFPSKCPSPSSHSPLPTAQLACCSCPTTHWNGSRARPPTASLTSAAARRHLSRRTEVSPKAWCRCALCKHNSLSSSTTSDGSFHSISCPTLPSVCDLQCTPGGNLLGTVSTGASTYDDVIVELDLATGQVVAVLARAFVRLCVWSRALLAQVIRFMNTSSIGNTGITAQAIACA